LNLEARGTLAMESRRCDRPAGCTAAMPGQGAPAWMPSFSKWFAIGIVLMLGRVSAAEAVSTASVDNLRVSWSDGVMAGGWRAVCGDVRNVGQLSARGIAIRVLGLGSASQVISTRDHYILADVPTGGRAVFMVLRADWRSLEAP
jgi:hypothetical protein